MTAIVLAGGESTRMGVNKAYLKVDGTPLVERVVKTLRGLFSNIIIVSNTSIDIGQPDVAVVGDVYQRKGPLAGIHAGLVHSCDELNFVAACDMPYLNPDLIALMMSRAKGYEITVPFVNGYLEPLHAVYSRSLLPRIEAMLAQDRRQIRGLFDLARVRYITEKETDPIDPLRRSYLNLNTPDEYKEATCLDLECRNC